MLLYSCLIGGNITSIFLIDDFIIKLAIVSRHTTNQFKLRILGYFNGMLILLTFNCTQITAAYRDNFAF